jgi:cytochrome P450
MFGAPYIAYVSRYAEAHKVMSSPAYRVPDLSGLRPPTGNTKLDQLNDRFRDNIFTVNDQEHAMRRKLVGAFFDARHLDVIRQYAEGYCQEAMDQLVERLQSGESVDVHTELSEYVACNTMARYIGVSPADCAVQKQYPVMILDASSPVRDSQRIALAVEAVDAQVTYFTELLRERRRSPKQDVASELAAYGAAHGIPEQHMVDVIWGIWINSFVTTVAAADAAMARMIRHPAAAQRIRRNPNDIDAFISETLRLDAPFPLTATVRAVAEETELGGTVLPAGTHALALLGAVNRDPNVFVNPDEFNLDRDFSKLMTFGRGIHYCVGARLVRMEMSIILRQLCQRLPDSVVVREAVRHSAATTRRHERLILGLQ